MNLRATPFLRVTGEGQASTGFPNSDASSLLAAINSTLYFAEANEVQYLRFRAETSGSVSYSFGTGVPVPTDMELVTPSNALDVPLHIDGEPFSPLELAYAVVVRFSLESGPAPSGDDVIGSASLLNANSDLLGLMTAVYGGDIGVLLASTVGQETLTLSLTAVPPSGAVLLVEVLVIGKKAET